MQHAYQPMLRCATGVVMSIGVLLESRYMARIISFDRSREIPAL
jgi:hypothetical protein